MPLKLDVDQTAASYLDYSKLLINSKDELQKILNKVPDYRTRPEKLRVEDLKIIESNFSFAVPKHELQQQEFGYANPIPSAMQKVPLKDIASVDINWRMLTMARPTTKFDEEYFNRIVFLERTTYKTVLKETEQAMRAAAKAANKNKKGRGGGGGGSGRAPSQKVGAMLMEGRHQTCLECGEEFCSGTCKEYLYEIHARLPPIDEDEDAPSQQPLEVAAKETKGNSKKVKSRIGGKRFAKKKEKKEGAAEKSKPDAESERPEENDAALKSPAPSPNPARKKASKKSSKKSKSAAEDSGGGGGELLKTPVGDALQLPESASGSASPKSIRSASSAKSTKSKKSSGIRSQRSKSPNVRSPALPRATGSRPKNSSSSLPPDVPVIKLSAIES